MLARLERISGPLTPFTPVDQQLDMAKEKEGGAHKSQYHRVDKVYASVPATPPNRR